MSKRVEAYRRTTKRLLANERAIGDAKELFKGLTPVRRLEFAEFLLEQCALEFANDGDAAEMLWASDLMMKVVAFKETLSQRASAGPAASKMTSRVIETPAAGLAPSADPSADNLEAPRTNESQRPT